MSQSIHTTTTTSTPSLDYYHLLEIKRSASLNEIHYAYRRLALHLHPHANIDADREKTNQWLYINEAYYVLISPKLRAIYDQYGYKILHHGNATILAQHQHQQSPHATSLSLLSQGAPLGIRIDPWKGITSEDCNKQFEQFFGTSSPFSVFNNIDIPLSVQPPITIPTCPTQYINVYISLEEFYTGIEKQIKVYTYVTDHNNTIKDQHQGEEEQQHISIQNYHTSIQQSQPSTSSSNSSPTNTRILQEKILTLSIGAGWKTGTQYTFKQEGHQQHGYHTGDIICTLVEKEHPRMRRKKNSLFYKHKLSLLHALTGTTIEIQTLDNRILPISLHDMICTPKNQKMIPNEGMPIVMKQEGKDGSSSSVMNVTGDMKKKYGNLYIEFDIEFPIELSIQQQNLLKQVLQ
jgi:DnaJ-class molecular chaperone